jgi:hypothetical protein
VAGYLFGLLLLWPNAVTVQNIKYNRKGISAHPHQILRPGSSIAALITVCRTNCDSFSVYPLGHSYLALEGSCPQLTSMPVYLEEVSIDRLPSSAYYVADFISKEEEKALLDKVVLYC